MTIVLTMPPNFRICRLKKSKHTKYYHVQEKRGRKYITLGIFKTFKVAVRYLFAVLEVKL